VGGGKRWGNSEGGWMWCKYCVHLHVNGKLISVETVPGMGEKDGWRRMMEEVNSSMIYLIQCKNFCKCHNVPWPSTTIKKKSQLFKFNMTNIYRYKSQEQNF
jgi:hypothetical protein